MTFYVVQCMIAAKKAAAEPCCDCCDAANEYVVVADSCDFKMCIIDATVATLYRQLSIGCFKEHSSQHWRLNLLSLTMYWTLVSILEHFSIYSRM